MSRQQIVYFDHNASTPCAPEVVKAMQPFFHEDFANPSSGHFMGRKAAKAVELARDHIAKLVDCSAEDLYFTSGATESNNLVLLGLARNLGTRKKIVISSIEHKSVLEPCRRLSDWGFNVIQVPVSREGVIDIDAARRLIDRDTLLVSVLGANNEIGTLQPIPTLTKISHDEGVLVHCDATQMLGKVPISLTNMGVDFASFSSHKNYGPKGIGAVYIRAPLASAAVEPLAFGGGQERSVRPGTLNVPAIVGFGEACRLTCSSLPDEVLHLSRLRDFLEQRITESIADASVVAASAQRLAGTTSIFIRNVAADALVARMPWLCVGTGSACASGAQSPSHVLVACGLGWDDAKCVIRISLGRYTTAREVEFAIQYLTENVDTLRHLVVGEVEKQAHDRVTQI
jgi:cysteine desulfurase